MVQGIDPVSAQIKLAQLLGDDSLMPQAAVPSQPVSAGSDLTTPAVNFSGNPFEDALAKAMQALEGVSRTENQTNLLINKYIQGEAELHEVMIAQAKMSVATQLAVTTLSSAVSSFQQITQMQI